MTHWVSNWNYLEAGIWGAFSLVFAFKAARAGTASRGSTAGAVAAIFFVFGITDVVEAHTGAWWRPWWLALWKGACIGGLIWGFRRMKSQARN